MCVALIGVLYAVILAIILLKSPDIIPEQRRGNVFSAVGYTCFVVPLLVFQVRKMCFSSHTLLIDLLKPWCNKLSIFQILLVNKEDGVNSLPYIAVVLPLLISLLTLILMSFGAKGGNHCTYTSYRVYSLHLSSHLRRNRLCLYNLILLLLLSILF